MNRYKIQGYVLAPFEVVVCAANEDEDEGIVEDLTPAELFKDELPDGERRIEDVQRVAPTSKGTP